MAGIFASGSQAAQTPAIGGLNIQTSAYGKAVQKVYGTTRIAPNLIWYANFIAHPHQQKVGKGGGSCFRGSVRVATPSGPRRIDQMAEGDAIYCRHPDTNAVEIGHVTAVAIHLLSDTPDHLLELTGADGVVLPGVTSNHHIWLAPGAYCEAQELALGDPLTLFDGSHTALVKTRAIEADPDETVHNLTVEPHHNYYAEGVLVHNGGGGKGSVTYTYTADLIFALGEGLLDLLGEVTPGVQKIWIDKALTTLAAQGMTFFRGDVGLSFQPTWSYLTAHYPSQAVPYSGIGYVGASPLQLGSNANLPNFNFEVSSAITYQIWTTGSDTFYTPKVADDTPSPYIPPINDLDVSPDYVVYDILYNTQYGVAYGQFPTTAQLLETLNLIGNLERATQTVVLSTVFFGPTEATGSWFDVPITVSSGCIPHSDISVIQDDGTVFARAGGSSPGPGQYGTVQFGPRFLYVFNPADFGKTVILTFSVKLGFLDYFWFCYYNRLWISPAYTDQRAATEVLQEIATNTYAEFVWSCGLLQLRPRVLYNSDGTLRTVAPLFDLTDDDFLPNQNSQGTSMTSDPVQIIRSRVSDQINEIQLEYLDRANAYAPAIAVATDSALMDAYGRRSTGSQQAHLFCDAQGANNSAWLQLQKQYIRTKYYFTTDMRYVVLDPMDIITLTDSVLGLNRTPVRVIEMTENLDGTINFTAEECPLGLGETRATYSLNQGQGYTLDTNADPGPVNAPIIFAAPTQLTGGALQIWAAVSGASANWGGCNIWISTDGGSSYNFAGRQQGPARMGTLNTLLPVMTDPDLVDTPTVDLTESFGDLVSVTQSEADQLLTVSIVDDEFLAYETATLIAPNTYQLSYLRRGLYGSSQSTHVSAPFARLDSSIFTFPYQASQIGQVVYIKFTSFNVFQAGEQNLADVVAFPYVVGSAPDTAHFTDTQNGAPDWPGTLSGFLKTWDGMLVPDSTVAANALTNVQLFTQFVPFPVASPSYRSPPFDLGSSQRVNVNIRPAAAAPGGAATVATSLDSWSTGSDPATFTAFATGSISARFFRAQIVEDTTVPAYITALALNLFT